LLLISLCITLPIAGLIVLKWMDTRQAARADALEKQLVEQRERADREMARLLGESRRAQFRVLRSRTDADGTVHNTYRFVEFFRSDDPTSITLAREFELPGAEFYVDAVLVHYDPEMIKTGRARNFSVFRRAFTNLVKPDDGESLYDDTLRQTRMMALTDLERPLIADPDAMAERLINYLNSPTRATMDGVRLIQGHAAYLTPKEGLYYEVLQQANGGLMVQELTIPPIFDEPTSSSATNE